MGLNAYAAHEFIIVTHQVAWARPCVSGGCGGMRRSSSAASLGAASNDGTGALARPSKSSRGAGKGDAVDHLAGASELDNRCDYRVWLAGKSSKAPDACAARRFRDNVCTNEAALLKINRVCARNDAVEKLALPKYGTVPNNVRIPALQTFVDQKLKLPFEFQLAVIQRYICDHRLDTQVVTDCIVMYTADGALLGEFNPFDPRMAHVEAGDVDRATHAVRIAVNEVFIPLIAAGPDHADTIDEFANACAFAFVDTAQPHDIGEECKRVAGQFLDVSSFFRTVMDPTPSAIKNCRSLVRVSELANGVGPGAWVGIHGATMENPHWKRIVDAHLHTEQFYQQIVVEYEQLLQGLGNNEVALIERAVSVLPEWSQKAREGGMTALAQVVIKAMTWEVGLTEGFDLAAETLNFNYRSKNLDKCLVELMSIKSIAPQDMASVKALRLRVNVITEKTSALCRNPILNDALCGVTRDRNVESFGPIRDALAKCVGLQIADPATLQNITTCLTTLEVMTKDIAEETATSDTLEGGYAKSADYVGLAEDIIKLIQTKEKRHNDLTVFFGAAKDVLAVKHAWTDFLECSNEEDVLADDYFECMIALQAAFDCLHDAERIAEREKHADGNDAAKQYMDYFACIISTVGTQACNMKRARFAA